MSFATILAAAKLLASLLPLISGLVQQAEADLAGVAGSSKLASVLSQVNAFLSKVTDDVNVISAVQSALTPVINELVATYKAVGIFKSSTAATISAPAA
jgi:phage-related minor tail protein